MAKKLLRTLALKPGDVAAQLQCSRAQAYRLIQRKEIPSFKLGADTRVSADALEAYVQKKSGK